MIIIIEKVRESSRKFAKVRESRRTKKKTDTEKILPEFYRFL